MDLDEGDDLDEGRESFWIRGQIDSPPCDPMEVEWRWENHLIEMMEVGVEVL